MSYMDRVADSLSGHPQAVIDAFLEYVDIRKLPNIDRYNALKDWQIKYSLVTRIEQL